MTPRQGSQYQYLVSWKGYDFSKATWEPKPHLANAPNILADSLRCVKILERSTHNRGANIITKCANEDSTQLECILMGRVYLVMGSWLLTGNHVQCAPLGHHLLQVAAMPWDALFKLRWCHLCCDDRRSYYSGIKSSIPLFSCFFYLGI